MKFLSSFFALIVLSGLAYGQDSKFFLLVENKDDKWQLKQISLDYPKYENKNQEILIVDRYNGYNIFPRYEETPDWKFLGKYAYKIFSDEPKSIANLTYECKTGSDSTKYTPCNSSMTSFLNTDFFGIAGKSRYTHNKAKLKKLMEDANLESEIQSCRVKYSYYASEFLKKNVEVNVKVIDQSTYYDNSKLYDIKPTNFDCVILNSNEIKYVIDTSSAANYNIDIDKREYKICSDNGKCKIDPTIKILSRNVKGLKVNDEFTDSILSFKIDEITYKDSNIVFIYSIVNNSKSYVTIDNVSLYLDDDIATDTFNRKVEMLPKSKLTGQQFFVRGENKKHANKINYALSKANENTNMTIGIASKYAIDGAQKSLFDSKEYSLKKLSGL